MGKLALGFSNRFPLADRSFHHASLDDKNRAFERLFFTRNRPLYFEHLLHRQRRVGAGSSGSVNLCMEETCRCAPSAQTSSLVGSLPVRNRKRCPNDGWTTRIRPEFRELVTLYFFYGALADRLVVSCRGDI